MKTQRLAVQTLVYTLAGIVTLTYLIPMLLVILTSLKSDAESKVMDFSLPSQWMWSNYATVLQNPKVLSGVVNGLIITTGVTFGAILLCSMAAYVIARRASPVSNGVFNFLLAGMVAPFSVIPAIKVLQFLGLYGTQPGLILTDIAIQIPFITMIYVGFIKQLPKDLDEAAFVDGAGPLTIFFRVIFPLLRPVTSTAAILLATFAWNEFQNVLYLMPDSRQWTMPMTVFDYRSLHTSDYSLVCANMVITILPVLALYLTSQKYIIQGMTAGAVKG